MRIAPQGFRYIGLLALLAASAYAIDPLRPLVVPLLVLAAFTAFFFRDPTRVPPADEKLLVSPADGKVVDVVPSPEDAEGTLIGIFLSIMDVHINRAPLTGTVERIRYTPGRFFAAYREEAKVANEKNEMALADGDYRVTVRQIDLPVDQSRLRDTG